MKKLLRRGVDQSAAARLRRRHPLQAPLQPLGPAPLPGPRRRPLPSRSATAAPRSSPTASRPSPRAGSSSSPARELEADVVVTATGLNLLFLGGAEAHRSTAQEPDLPRALHLQGDDAQRRPQLRLHARLHQRLLDAEGRPHLRIRLPPAQPHGRQRPRVCDADVDRPLGHRGAAAGLQLRLRPARPRRACRNRARRSRGNCARTTRSTCACCAAARSRTARCASPTRDAARLELEPATQVLASSS